MERAVKELRTAMCFEPGDAKIKKELTELEKEVEAKRERDSALAMQVWKSD